MSGHSKWSTIKRQKGAADAKRSTTFTKLAYAITVATREGGGDPTSNFKLRLAMEKARQANMPKDNIERAVKRGTGELGGANFEHIVYEAYSPGGVALLIEVDTDNRNRAVANIKSLLNKYNGKLAEAGSVGYLFHPRGVMSVVGEVEALELAIIESGADDYDISEEGAVVYTQPRDLVAVAKSLELAGFTVSDMSTSMEALAPVVIAEQKTAQTIMRLMHDLEDLDDVSAVHTNFDLAPNLELA